MTEKLSIRAYAKRRGVSHTAVAKAIKSGRITIGADGKIDPALADAQWSANTDETKPLNSVSGNPQHRRPTGAPPTPGAGTDPEPRSEPMQAVGGDDLPKVKGTGYTQARAVREGYEARLKKLEFEEKSGKLVNADEVRVAAFNAARKVRDAFFSIPDRIAPILAGTDDAKEVHRLLTEEIRIVCTNLSNNGHTGS